MLRAIVLLRTPLQAILADKVLRAEGITHFDLIYLSLQSSRENDYYYRLLATRAANAYHLRFSTKSSLVEIFCSIWSIRQLSLQEKYDFAVFGALTSIPILRTAMRKAPRFLTVDDGVANLNANSRLFADPVTLRARLYRWLFGGVDLATAKTRITRHYTLHPQFANIVAKEKIVAVDVWGARFGATKPSLPPRSYFIGTVVDRFFSPDLDHLEGLLLNFQIDKYVCHPREHSPPSLGVPVLEKRGRIAEDAILDDAGGHPVILIGWPSTVLLNFSSALRRVVVFPRAATGLESVVQVFEDCGCEVVFL